MQGGSLPAADLKLARRRIFSQRGQLWRHRLMLPGVLALAAMNFGWQLGSSSYYVDEVQSIGASVSPIGDLLHAINITEITPPAYFLFLHEWLYRLGTRTEWVARLPSALCGVLVVAAIYWLASIVCDRRAVPLGSAAVAALSPFVLQYAQRAQAYVFVMLFVTIAVACAVHAERARTRRGLWLIAAGAASAFALSLHYTAGLVILPLCAWIATRDTLRMRWRLGFIGTCLFVELALIPVLLTQHKAFPNRTGVAASTGVSWANVARMFEVPFDGRASALRLLGVAVTSGSVIWLIASRSAIVRERRLLVGLGAGIPVLLLVLSAFGGHLMLTRYAAVSVPFAIIAIASAATALRAPVRLLLAVCVIVVALSGLRASHRQEGFYFDARGVVSYLHRHELPGDAVLIPQEPAVAVPLIHYELIHPYWFGDPETSKIVLARKRRLWELLQLHSSSTTPAQVLAFIRPALAPFGYRLLRARVFPSVVPVALVLEAPVNK